MAEIRDAFTQHRYQLMLQAVLLDKARFFSIIELLEPFIVVDEGRQLVGLVCEVVALGDNELLVGLEKGDGHG